MVSSLALQYWLLLKVLCPKDSIILFCLIRFCNSFRGIFFLIGERKLLLSVILGKRDDQPLIYLSSRQDGICIDIDSDIDRGACRSTNRCLIDIMDQIKLMLIKANIFLNQNAACFAHNTFFITFKLFFLSYGMMNRWGGPFKNHWIKDDKTKETLVTWRSSWQIKSG